MMSGNYVHVIYHQSSVPWYCWLHTRKLCNTVLQQQITRVVRHYSISCQNTLHTTLPFNLRQDHLQMRAFSYASSLPITWQRWRSTIWSAVVKNPMLHANFTALCSIKLELLLIEVSHCRNRNFRPVWLLWPWPWPDNLHIRTWPVSSGDVLD